MGETFRSVAAVPKKRKATRNEDQILAIVENPTDEYAIYAEYIASKFRELKFAESKTQPRLKIQCAI